MSFITKMFGDPNEKELRKIRPIVSAINDLEDDIKALSDDDMRSRVAEMRAELENTEDAEQEEHLDTLLPEAFAMVREASVRAIGQRHFDMQLIGGVILHQGKIAEMRTGEGKTLVATLPVFLNALTGRGVHVVTVNDYLAQYHAEWMGRIYRFLGLSVGCILSGVEHGSFEEKRSAYHSDVTYGTNNEFGFDYLRDNMSQSLEGCTQRELRYAIVDEIDNILIDEARTPLIISAPTLESAEMYHKFASVTHLLQETEDYEIDQRTKTVLINEHGIDKVEAALGIPEIYSNPIYTRFMENAIKAQIVMHRDKDYVVKNGEVIIVDEHTGRLMEGRRFNEGLHQAIEAKERVKVREENRTVATITFQNYFRLYHKLGGMTGTALTEAQEFDKIYHLDVVVVPTNRPMIRNDETDYIFKSASAKYHAVVNEVKDRHEAGQPVLIGTTSVAHSERVSTMLFRAGVPHEILNAKNHAREAEIIAQAGRLGAVTISTNMAGRGTDILLGGNPEKLAREILGELDIDEEIATENDWIDAQTKAKDICEEERKKVVELGGLCVIGTERHDSRRIDNQLRGRAGRQGDPGISRFYLSLEDELLVRFGGERVSGLMNLLRMDEEIPIENAMASKVIEQAQQKVEAYYFDIRKHVVEYDDVIARQRETIYGDRQAILRGIELHDRILNMIRSETEAVCETACSSGGPETWNLQAIFAQFEHWRIPLPDDIVPDNIHQLKKDQFINRCVDWAVAGYEAKEERIQSELDKIPGAAMDVSVFMNAIERNSLLRVVDSLWMEHIDMLDELRSSIGLRGMAQADPLVEFKREAFKAFDSLKKSIQHYVTESVLLTELQFQAAPPPQELPDGQPAKEPVAISRKENKKSAKKSTGHNKQAKITNTNTGVAVAENPLSLPAAAHAPNRKNTISGPAVKPVIQPPANPNAPCPCGSKQKYKFCHGIGAKKS